MSTIEKIRQGRGKWLFVAPITGLLFSKDIKEEFLINNITFISKRRLVYVWKRLGFPSPISKMKNKFHNKTFFEGSTVYAVCLIGGIGKDKEIEFLESVRNGLNIFSLSQLGWGRRKGNARLSISREQPIGSNDYLMLNTTKNTSILSSNISGKFKDLTLDKRWVKYQKNHFIFEIIEMFQGKYSVSDGWRRDILNASRLAGESQSSTDLANAFLWNMIAIETLLTQQGDSYSTALPERVEAFIGWTTNWAIDDFESKIKEIYKKRSAFVHAGRKELITIPDLLFSDTILLNVFVNIIKHLEIFKDKNAVIAFSEKVKAEHTLGIKSKVRPKTIVFLNPIYTEKDLEGI